MLLATSLVTAAVAMDSDDEDTGADVKLADSPRIEVRTLADLRSKEVDFTGTEFLGRYAQLDHLNTLLTSRAKDPFRSKQAVLHNLREVITNCKEEASPVPAPTPEGAFVVTIESVGAMSRSSTKYVLDASDVHHIAFYMSGLNSDKLSRTSSTESLAGDILKDLARQRDEGATRLYAEYTQKKNRILEGFQTLVSGILKEERSVRMSAARSYVGFPKEITGLPDRESGSCGAGAAANTGDVFAAPVRVAEVERTPEPTKTTGLAPTVLVASTTTASLAGVGSFGAAQPTRLLAEKDPAPSLVSAASTFSTATTSLAGAGSFGAAQPTKVPAGLGLAGASTLKAAPTPAFGGFGSMAPSSSSLTGGAATSFGSFGGFGDAVLPNAK